MGRWRRLWGWTDEQIAQVRAWEQEARINSGSRFGFGPEAAAGPLNMVLKSGSITGLGPATRLKEVAQAHGRYFHFTMRGATIAPLSRVLSPQARKELDALLEQEPNKSTFDALVQEVTGESKP